MAGIYWGIPILIVSSLLAGVAFAVGHHFWYYSLNGSEVSNDAYSFANHSVSRQQINIAIGTGLAFLVKIALVAAVSTTYVQLLWRGIKIRSTRLDVLDTLFSALGNAFTLLKLQVWFKHPLLLLLGLLTWLIPFTSIVTPGTLSVRSVQVSPDVQLMDVPRINFESLNYHFPLSYSLSVNRTHSHYSYSRYSRQLAALTTSVLTEGRVVDLASTLANASWTTSFFGPSLTCSDPSAQEYHNITKAVINPLNVYGPFGTDRGRAATWAQIWIPNGTNVDPPLRGLDSDLAATVDRATKVVAQSGQYFSLFGMSIPPNDGQLFADINRTEEAFQQLNATLFKCTFVNASYSAQIDIINGQHTVRTTKNNAESTPRMRTTLTGPQTIRSSSEENHGDMNITLAQQQLADSDCNTFNDRDLPCIYDAVVVREMAYQSIILSYLSIVIGIFEPGSREGQSVGSIGKTALMNTDEVLALSRDSNPRDDSTFLDLQAIIGESKGSRFVEIQRSIDTPSLGPMATALEESFTNVTLSLLSDPRFQTGPIPTNVTTIAFHNVYEYDKLTLWLAYSLAVALTALASILGILTMIAMDAAYDSSFSTILRAGTAAHLTERMTAIDGSGKAPLPKHLASAKLLFNDRTKSAAKAEPRSELSKGASMERLELIRHEETPKPIHTQSTTLRHSVTV
ncbi:hypothetical protein AMS68_005454 [Peltaster fructicola]|uniref:Transmembrane protein n=1 Tax=Peltaster fructicola TaxID=286661 RepID=A0A6H0XYW4_9PEZI|nr:hypothetical protein AMS68_005454 [Peltaster fructicola]